MPDRVEGPFIRWMIAGELWDDWHRIRPDADRTACGILVPAGEVRMQESRTIPSAMCAYCRPLVFA